LIALDCAISRFQPSALGDILILSYDDPGRVSWGLAKWYRTPQLTEFKVVPYSARFKEAKAFARRL